MNFDFVDLISLGIITKSWHSLIMIEDFILKPNLLINNLGFIQLKYLKPNLHVVLLFKN